MKLGLYEQLIHKLTRDQLSSLDPSLFHVGKESLDPEEARKQLLQEGMLEAARNGRMLGRPPGRHFAVIRQQIASYLFQAPRYRRAAAAKSRCSLTMCMWTAWSG
ncbi:hypothetical protein MJA45_03960 [Paenibacillus aurantius]|uniref:Uncharacterized protein n=1 Tax=Paenibacillus aurantius TaxID=2918900 RepID=A0AA96LEG4_9BACL|nr:hypothetical protein [Paenibacillus aurantius]WNQ12216.1 hypothetical protein MJA45_03960 [Paenibacillus aurantius]